MILFVLLAETVFAGLLGLGGLALVGLALWRGFKAPRSARKTAAAVLALPVGAGAAIYGVLKFQEVWSAYLRWMT